MDTGIAYPVPDPYCPTKIGKKLGHLDSRLSNMLSSTVEPRYKDVGRHILKDISGCRKCDDQRMTADDTHRPLVPFADLN